MEGIYPPFAAVAYRHDNRCRAAATGHYPIGSRPVGLQRRQTTFEGIDSEKEFFQSYLFL